MEESDLDLLTQELTGVERNWEKIGLGLGLEEYHLSRIRAKHSTSHNCMGEMLRFWLLNLVPQPDGFIPTWRNIVDALRSPRVGDPQLADQLEAKYCPSEFINNNILLYFSEYNVVQH